MQACWHQRSAGANKKTSTLTPDKKEKSLVGPRVRWLTGDSRDLTLWVAINFNECQKKTAPIDAKKGGVIEMDTDCDSGKKCVGP